MKKILSFIFCSLIFLIFYNIINFKEAFTNIISANSTYVIYGISLSVLWPIFGFFRWKFILKAFNYKPLDNLIFSSVLISYSANLMIPGKGGDLSKALTISKTDKSKFIIPVIVERFGDVFTLTMISIIGSLYLNELYFFILSFCILFTLISIIYLSPVIKRVQFLNKKFSQVNNLIKDFSNIKNIIKSEIKYISVGLIFSSLNWIFASIQIWFFFQAFSVNIQLLNIIMIFPIVILFSLIPITPGGFGVRESLFLVMFSKFTSIETCVIVSLNYYIFSIVLLGFIGLLYFYKFFNKS